MNGSKTAEQVGGIEQSVEDEAIGEGSTDSTHLTYSDYADAYFRTRFGFDPRRDLVWSEVCRYLQNAFIPEDARVLDVGAGYCNFINNVRGSERHAVDLFTELPDFAEDGVHAHVGSCTDMSFLADDSIDIAFTSNLFEHLTREQLIPTMNELRRVVRTEGTLIVLQPNFRFCYNTYFDDYTHLQIFTDRSLFDLLEVFGFRVREAKPRFLPVNMKSTLRLRLPMLRQIVRFYLALPFKPLAGQMLFVCENTPKV
ncbi:MAG: class I SAM-dependent methyltransferase [Gemmatimonadota bacterium]|nr:class I SAM-dependent methyltransferase [Gemmatimonadota bacterium]